MARKNTTRYAILGMLSYKPMTGYELKSFSDHSIGYFWNENYGRIYPVLRELEAEGLAKPVDPSGAGRSDRKPYAITPAGRDALAAWLVTDPDPLVLRMELLLKAFFAHWAGPDALIRQVEAHKAQAEATLAELRAIEEHNRREHREAVDLAAREAGGEAALVAEAAEYWRLTIRYGLEFYGAAARWADESLRTLRALAGRKARSEEVPGEGSRGRRKI